MPIRCIAFDLDDTFWDCDKLIQNAEQQLYQWLEKHCSVITDRYTPQELVQERHTFFSQHPNLHHDLGRLRLYWLEMLLQEYQQNPEWAKPAFQVFFEARNDVEFFPQVLESLQQLQSRYQLGVITNGNADVHRIGIGHLFDFTHSSAEAGVHKPDKAIFQQAVSKAAVQPAEMLYVGDSWENDIIGANRAGLRTLWFNPMDKPQPTDLKPDGIMTHFSELESLLIQIED